MGDAKHLPPLRAEEEGKGDTWAMLILGERYDPQACASWDGVHSRSTMTPAARCIWERPGSERM